ncbi:MAG: HEAT repeat domain-containing protein [Candidatus Thorarchaeota archaeon]|nr:HEAT repeat domain-containing protein [Candidatus Thorarchaeota archaeon]
MTLNEELLSAIECVDLVRGSQLLLELSATHTPERVSSCLEEIGETLGGRRLCLRDQVVSLLGTEPFYFAVGLPSSRLLTICRAATTIVDIRRQALGWLRNALSWTPGPILVSRVDVEAAASTEHAVLLQDVLKERVDEMARVEVPHSHSVVKGRAVDRFYVGALRASAYGRMVLGALGVDVRTDVVGLTIWGQVQAALAAAGFPIESRVVSVPEDDWLSEVERLRDMNRLDRSAHPELILLERLFWAQEDLQSRDERTVLRALDEIEYCGSIFCSRVLMSLIPRGPLSIRKRALQVLAASGDPGCEQFLTRLLSDRDHPLRADVAEALSVLASRGFVRSRPTPPPPEPRARVVVKDGERVARMTEHPCPDVRAEAARLLLMTLDEDELPLLARLLEDESEKVRAATVQASRWAPHSVVSQVIERGLTDESELVRAAARELESEFAIG